MSLLFKTLCLIASLISFNQARAEALYFYHNDHLGTPQLLTDSEQNVVWQADYDAFGQAKITLEHVEQNLRFPGQYHDAETGLHYNYYRDYDPKTGRYLQSDPIGLAGGINTYAYVGGNPLGYSDPTGLAAETLLDAAALALSAHDFQQCPSFSNGLWLLADVISTTIPGLPAIGIARHVDRLGDVTNSAVRIPGRVQSRVNLSNSGIDHTLKRHLNPARSGNKSQFNLSESELRSLLGSKSTVQAPVSAIPGSDNFIRTITTDRSIGNLSNNLGGGSTNTFSVITDKAGNLQTAFPGGL